MIIKNLNQAELEKTFGVRLLTLCNGMSGIRGVIKSEVKEIAGTAPVMEFIGSDSTLDRYNEVIDQAGWQLDNFRANPVIPDCHNYDTVARILGRALSVEVRDGKLINRVEFCLDNPLGAIAYKMAKGGFIKSQSVGFIPLEWKNGTKAGEPDRLYTKAELLEISLVVVPANPGATVGIKSAFDAGAIGKADIKSAVDFLKQFCSDTENPDAKAGASGAGVDYAQKLQDAKAASLIRTLCETLGH